jgi:tetratricopeptide (TPR) repeat protein
MYHFQGRSFEAVVAEALSLGRLDADAWVQSFALFMQGLAAFDSGDHEQATARALEALAAAEVSREIIQQSGPLLILASIAVSRGDYDRAQDLYDQSIDASRRDGDAWSLGILLTAAAGLRIVRGDFDGASAQASEAMSVCQQLEDPRESRGASMSSRTSWPPKETRTEPPSCGGASDGLLEDRRELAVGRKSDGSGIATVDGVKDRRSVSDHSRLLVPRGARCRSPHAMRLSESSGANA